MSQFVRVKGLKGRMGATGAGHMIRRVYHRRA